MLAPPSAFRKTSGERWHHPRKPVNPDDVIFFPDGKTRTKCFVLTADHKNHEPRDLTFPSGSKLHFLVSFEKTEKGWEVTRYNFHLSRGNHWFRYDLDPDAAHGQRHPLAHLHVGQDEPRYPTHILNGLDLLDFFIEQNLI
jgi:hypothetical protein